MDTVEFREAMHKFTEKIISSKETLSDGQWIDFERVQSDFNDLVTKYLEKTW